MFRFSFFADDKHVTTIARAIAGKALELKMEPVINVKKKAGGGVNITGENVVTLLAAHLAKEKITELQRKDLAAFLDKIGRAPGSATYLATQAIEHRILRRIGKGFDTRYKVIPPRKEAQKGETA